ncbi:uncharacterized protein LOC109542956 [Dendroctonus ponderosae]|uniref:uncharacterized protein LOC109542956 n=1 Tax=Dendroctonus ponderosae TaxID=77166 RepID=UPI0020365893|nr:uncharacterized protein LOC109542956 [Dendroctonus ponderosae]
MPAKFPNGKQVQFIKNGLRRHCQQVTLTPAASPLKIAMLSSIFPISVSDKEAESAPSTARPGAVFPENAEQQSTSLLSVLDDKNLLIAALRKQLQNQKTQLSYYIKRELNGNRIQQLSLSCTPLAYEYSLPLTLAMNQFCKQAGIKSNLAKLHERLKRLDSDLSNALKDQEFVLRKIVNKLCEFLRFQEICNGDQFGGFISSPLHVDLFDQLLTATVGLRRRLEAFRICCDRLILVEEERSAIVDQVYSLPAGERTTRNALLDIQMEKARLESELLHPRGPQDLNAIEDLLQQLQVQLNCSFGGVDSKESSVSRMLTQMNSEAKLLLEATKQQREKQRNAPSKAKSPEPNRVLLFIKLAGDDNVKRTDLESWGIKSSEELTFFALVRDEVQLVTAKERQESNKSRQEADLFKKKLNQAQLENARELDKLRADHDNQAQALRQQRDLYKAQVEDLQAIRAAYAQLVEKPQPKQAAPLDAAEWKSLLLQQMGQVEALKAKLADQRDQIQVLSRFINLTRPNSPTLDKFPIKKPRGKRPLGFPVNAKTGAQALKLKKPTSSIRTRTLGSRGGGSFQLVAQRSYAWQTKGEDSQGNLTLEKSSMFSVEFQLKNQAAIDKKNDPKQSLEELLAARCSADVD